MRAWYEKEKGYVKEAGPDRIAVFGDVHGRINQFCGIINDYDIHMAVVCGDFLGFGAREERLKLMKELVPWCQIFWADGNHEDHNYLKLMMDLHGKRKFITFEEADNVHYCPRGTSIELPDGRVMMFAGGGVSIDRAWREEGVTWFPQEVLTIDDIDWVPEVHVDILITHTCGRVNLQHMLPWNEDKCIDASYDAIDWLLTRTTPDLWFFGHWHHFLQGHFANTIWTALDRDGSFDWWMWLPEGGYDIEEG